MPRLSEEPHFGEPRSGSDKEPTPAFDQERIAYVLLDLTPAQRAQFLDLVRTHAPKYLPAAGEVLLRIRKEELKYYEVLNDWNLDELTKKLATIPAVATFINSHETNFGDKPPLWYTAPGTKRLPKAPTLEERDQQMRGTRRRGYFDPHNNDEVID